MTILEQLQSAFPDVEGIGDARNIAEALAMISGAGGRGANAIADKVSNPGGSGGGNVWDELAKFGVPNIYSIGEITGPTASYIVSKGFAFLFTLESVFFPNVVNIGQSAFEADNGLLTVLIPNADYIGQNAFNQCNRLQTIAFPNVTTIDNGAFMSCDNLISLNLTGVGQVPSLGTDVFASTPIGGYSASAGQYGSVYVPASLYSAFLSADNWSSIASCIVSVPES